MDILFGLGNGAFDSVNLYSLGSSRPVSAAVADLNNDRCLDIIVANYDTSSIHILLGYGFHPDSIVIGDFNKDNILDVAIADSENNNIPVLHGSSNGTLTTRETHSTGANSTPMVLAEGDFNNDQYVAKTFANQTTYFTGAYAFSISVAVGDFDEDSVLDISVANRDNNNVGVFIGHGDGTFAPLTIYSTGDSFEPEMFIVRDLNNGNRPNIIISSQPFLSTKSYSTGNDSHPQSIIIADLNDNSRMDIIVANYGKDNISILLGYGNETFMEQITHTTGRGSKSKPRSIAFGYFNNDTLLDIVVANAGTNNVGILLGYGNGIFSNITLYSTDDSVSPSSVAVSDFNNDKYLNIAKVNADSKIILLLYGNSNGTFENAKSYLLEYESRPYSVAVGDFNRDNWIDIAIANYGTDNVNIIVQICNAP
ncbi:unnamed protein product [Rotaria socialis]|uniref:VCBS repeat-containing protein n=1 Tax=Rotaria socialis TaxID=392032 RepID=A0A820X1Z2_9BILA|nr:unnamed protein product [Rotaria socialis]